LDFINVLDGAFVVVDKLVWLRCGVCEFGLGVVHLGLMCTHELGFGVVLGVVDVLLFLWIHYVSVPNIGHRIVVVVYFLDEERFDLFHVDLVIVFDSLNGCQVRLRLSIAQLFEWNIHMHILIVSVWQSQSLPFRFLNLCSVVKIVRYICHFIRILVDQIFFLVFVLFWKFFGLMFGIVQKCIILITRKIFIFRFWIIMRFNIW